MAEGICDADSPGVFSLNKGGVGIMGGKAFKGFKALM